MPVINQTWPVDKVRAVSIWVPRGDMHVYGTDENQIRLQGDSGEWHPDAIQPVVSGEWLVINAWDDRNPSFDLSLGLPRSQAWVVELSSGNGDIHVQDVQARFQIGTGRGDVHLANSRGILSIRTGNGDINIEDWVEQAMPERPTPPAEVEGTPPSFVEASNFNVPGPRDWFEWGPKDWNAWGMQFGDQARRWTHQFRHFWDHFGRSSTKAGINLHTGNGDASLRKIEASNCSIVSGRGDQHVKEGQVSNLSLSTAHGDIEVAGVLPIETWSIKSMYGDIDLTLPADAQGRLDAATRKGDLRSDVPLVRVARPGPESHGGGRMVGALGSAESARAQIDLVTQHGDISIHLGPASRRTPVSDSQPAEAASSSGPAVQPEGAEGEAYPTADVQNVETNPATTENNHPVEVQAAVEPRTEDPALAILQALEDGLINVEEADRMLQELPRAGQ